VTDLDRPYVPNPERVELHEFVPFPITAQEEPGHICRGGCACDRCSRRKGDRAAHYQTRDRRRPAIKESVAPAAR
jgi:hypothetical protein